MSEPLHNLTPAKIRQVDTMKRKGFGVRDIALCIDCDVHVLREYFRGKKRVAPGKPARCPKCGHVVQMPCLECAIEAQKQANREARFLVSSQG